MSKGKGKGAARCHRKSDESTQINAIEVQVEVDAQYNDTVDGTDIPTPIPTPRPRRDRLKPSWLVEKWCIYNVTDNSARMDMSKHF